MVKKPCTVMGSPSTLTVTSALLLRNNVLRLSGSVEWLIMSIAGSMYNSTPMTTSVALTFGAPAILEAGALMLTEHDGMTVQIPFKRQLQARPISQSVHHSCHMVQVLTQT